jgi:hypothetical protein
MYTLQHVKNDAKVVARTYHQVHGMNNVDHSSKKGSCLDKD